LQVSSVHVLCPSLDAGVGLPTEHWDDIRRRRQRLPDNQQEDDERQQDRDLEVDLLAGLDRQKEAKERDGVDEQAREDEVDEKP